MTKERVPLGIRWWLNRRMAYYYDQLRAENDALGKQFSDASDALLAKEKENAELRAQLARLAEAGTGYSQQTMDAPVRERNDLQAENAALAGLRGLERAVRSIGDASYWRGLSFRDCNDGLGKVVADALDDLEEGDAEGPEVKS